MKRAKWKKQPPARSEWHSGAEGWAGVGGEPPGGRIWTERQT